MIIPTDTLVLIADGRKSIFLRNHGTALAPRFEVEAHREIELPLIHAEAGNPGSAMDDPDAHQQEEVRFAIETAEDLRKRVLDKDFEALVVVAPPRTLGVLRTHYDPMVTARLLGEISKDLTGHPINAIEALLSR